MDAKSDMVRSKAVEKDNATLLLKENIEALEFKVDNLESELASK